MYAIRSYYGIAWGGDRVAELTLARARRLGLRFEMLPVLNDIDTSEDLWLAAQAFEPLRTFLYRLLAQQLSEQL